MALSGSYDFTMTRDTIISAAFRKSGISTPNATDVTNAAEALNLICKALQTDNEIWTRNWTQKTFSASSEVTGTDGSIYTCILSHTSAASNKPVTGANYSTYWIVKGTTGGTWVTATAYVSIGDFTLTDETVDIEKAFIRDTNSNDYPVRIVPLTEYLSILDKSNTGRPYMLVFDKQLSPVVYLYYQPDVTTYVLHYLRIKRLQDFDASADNPDFPVHWFRYLVYALSAEIAPDLQKLSVGEIDRLELKATKLLNDAISISNETSDGEFIKGAFER